MIWSLFSMARVGYPIRRGFKTYGRRGRVGPIRFMRRHYFQTSRYCLPARTPRGFRRVWPNGTARNRIIHRQKRLL